MFLRGRVPIPFTESIIDQEDDVCILVQTYCKVVRFNVAMDETLLVDVLKPKNHLSRQHANGL